LYFLLPLNMLVSKKTVVILEKNRKKLKINSQIDRPFVAQPAVLKH